MQTARELDESTHFVCPSHAMFSLAESMPQTVAELVGCCTPCPLLVRQRAHEIVIAVVEATRGASSIPNTPALGGTQAKAIPAAIGKPAQPATAAASAPPKRGEARKQWREAHDVPVAALSAQQPMAAGRPVKGSLSWEVERVKPNAAVQSKVQQVLQEIGQMTLLQVC